MRNTRGLMDSFASQTILITWLFFHQTAIIPQRDLKALAPKASFFLVLSAAYLEHQLKKAQSKNLVQVTYYQDKPKVSSFEFNIWHMSITLKLNANFRELKK